MALREPPLLVILLFNVLQPRAQSMLRTPLSQRRIVLPQSVLWLEFLEVLVQIFEGRAHDVHASCERPLGRDLGRMLRRGRGGRGGCGGGGVVLLSLDDRAGRSARFGPCATATGGAR